MSNTSQIKKFSAKKTFKKIIQLKKIYIAFQQENFRLEPKLS